MTLRINLLGPLRITKDGAPLELPGHRPAALLAYLLVTGKSHQRAHLTDLLFVGPKDPRAALRWTLTKLRKVLGAGSIHTAGEVVSFNFQSDYWLDVEVFAKGELELYRGDLLEGFGVRDAFQFEEWLLFERERLRGYYIAGLEGRLQQQEQQADHAAVITTAHQLLAMDNLRENWHRSLMMAYAQQGKREAALAQFALCRQVLRAELGVDPAPETAALAEAIDRGEFAPPPSPVSGRSRFPASPVTGQFAGELAGEPQSGRFPIKPIYAVIGLVALLAAIMLLALAVSEANLMGNEGRAEQASQTIANEEDAAPQAFSGTRVTVVGPANEAQVEGFERSMARFEDDTGIDVVYLTPGTEFESYIAESLAGDAPPDLVHFPQPGSLMGFVEQGKIIPVTDFLDEDYLRQQYPDPFLEMVTNDGEVMGLWYTAGLKSLVWYPKRVFEERGYEVPDTWEELMALTQQIAADGGHPWCIGIENGGASGWVGTDWVEDILLRTAPPAVYDAWVSGELPFDSPEIRRVFEIMGQIWLNDAYVYGGTAAIAQENVFKNPAHLFEDPPGCYLHRQGSFALHFFPETLTLGQDYDFFYLPPIDARFGHPVLGSGELFAMVNDRPEVREVMRYISTPESAQVFITSGGFLSPHKNTPLSWFPTAADLRFQQIILSADTYRFDGSDLMPLEVGSQAFYRGIVDWVEGAELEAVLQQIDASRP